MLGRSVTFRPESIEKRSQRGTLKNLTTPNRQSRVVSWRFETTINEGKAGFQAG